MRLYPKTGKGGLFCLKTVKVHLRVRNGLGRIVVQFQIPYVVGSATVHLLGPVVKFDANPIVTPYGGYRSCCKTLVSKCTVLADPDPGSNGS